AERAPRPARRPRPAPGVRAGAGRTPAATRPRAPRPSASGWTVSSVLLVFLYLLFDPRQALFQLRRLAQLDAQLQQAAGRGQADALACRTEQLAHDAGSP